MRIVSFITDPWVVDRILRHRESGRWQNSGSFRDEGAARCSVGSGSIMPMGRQAFGWPADTRSVKVCPVVHRMLRRRARHAALAETGPILRPG